MVTGRRLWLAVHRWIALSIGLILALLGATGAAMVLRTPILQWEVGAGPLTLRAAPAPGTAYASPHAWQEAALAAYPQLQRALGTAPPNGGFLLSDNAMVFGPVQGRQAMGIAMLDPYTAAPRGFFVFDDLWLARIVAFHRALMLPARPGSQILAACGMVLLASLFTGLWLWWPRGTFPGRWRRAFTISLRGRSAQRWLALHNLAAVYLFLPLLLLTTSGVILAQPTWFGWLGLSRGPHSVLSALHAHLMLGMAGEIVTFLAGVALPVLYVSGLSMWWGKRRARRQAAG